MKWKSVKNPFYKPGITSLMDEPLEVWEEIKNK